jgi:hypothetical protein
MDIILGKERKRWSEDQKREIVAETIAAGEVTGVARRHGANPSMKSERVTHTLFSAPTMALMLYEMTEC